MIQHRSDPDGSFAGSLPTPRRSAGAVLAKRRGEISRKQRRRATRSAVGGVVKRQVACGLGRHKLRELSSRTSPINVASARMPAAKSALAPGRRLGMTARDETKFAE